MSTSWPTPAELDDLFRLLCTGDPLAVGDFVAAVLDPLAAHLRYRHREADEHACLSAAEDALLGLIHNPAGYDPTLRGLRGFLCMCAERDLVNALQKERRHHAGRKSSECVELASDAGNTPASERADDLPSFDDPHLATEIASFDAPELAVFERMRAGERATAVFAAALDLGHLPDDEQAREVKRVKDRIVKRLKRAGGQS